MRSFSAARNRPLRLHQLSRLQELLQSFRLFLKKMGEVREDLDRVGAEMMFDAFDVPFLSLGVESKQRKKPRERFVTFLDVASHTLSLFSQHKPAIFFVVEVTQFAEFLYHTGDRRLLD